MLVCPKCGSIYTREIDHCGLDGERLVTTTDDPLIGRTIGRYRIEEPIGAGGMARVYRAFHTTLEHDIALKVLHGEFAADKDLSRRFHREAKALSRIKHENVVNVADFGATPEGLLFMVMEYLDGPTLSQALRTDGTLPPRRAARILRQLCEGLSAAHARGYVHRDLKPGNVVLTRDGDREVAKILDFGLVRITEPDEGTAPLTQQGMFFGTPAYMSPEQIRGEEAGPRADLYALGVMLYQMLTGVPPFQGEIKQLAQQHLHEPPPVPPLSYGGLAEIALDLLEKEPDARPASAMAVVARIDTLTLAPEPSRIPRPARVAPAEAPTRAERSALSAPVLADEHPLDPDDDEHMSVPIREALGMRAYIGGKAAMGAFLIVAGALAFYFWSGGQLPPAVDRLFSSASAGPSAAVHETAPATEPPPPAAEAPPKTVATDTRAPKRGTPAPKATAKPKSPAKAAPKPATPKPPASKPAPSKPAPAPTEPEAPVETVEATDYETAGTDPEPEPSAPVKSFSELDMNLGWALNQKGLAWADLAEAAPQAARQWGRWYKRTAEPDPKVLDATFTSLMDAVDAITVDAALLKRKLARCQRILKRESGHAGAPRYDALGGRFAALTRDVGFSPLRREPVSISAELSMLERDLEVFAREAGDPEPEPEPEPVEPAPAERAPEVPEPVLETPPVATSTSP